MFRLQEQVVRYTYRLKTTHKRDSTSRTFRQREQVVPYTYSLKTALTHLSRIIRQILLKDTDKVNLMPVLQQILLDKNLKFLRMHSVQT